MQKKTILLLIIGLVLIGVFGWAYSNWKTYAPTTYVQESTEDVQPADSAPAGTSTATTTIKTVKTVTVNTKTGTTTPGAPSYTLAQIATHNNASSCYSVINGKVYDLTLWINMHPGGKSRILAICGIDGSSAFNAQHGGERKPMTALARFLIGTLTN